MTRYGVLCFTLFFAISIFAPLAAVSADPTILEFRVQPLYRSAKLILKTKDGLKNQMSVQILRAETFEEGPYKELDVINLVPDKNAYDYVDKTVGSESKYYYKLVVKETGESFGPVVTRPFFSPPATRLQTPKQDNSVLVLR